MAAKVDTVCLKLVLPDQSVRRISCPTNKASFEAVQNYVYQVTHRELDTLTFTDPDGDTCTVSTQAEFEEACRLATPVVRMAVQICTPSGADVERDSFVPQELAPAFCAGSSADVSIYVNGEKITFSGIDPSTPLVSAIRDYTRFTGTKLSCGEGGCGACVVVLSSTPPSNATGPIRENDITHSQVNSCLRPIFLCDGMSVTTSEGIGSHSAGYHDVQTKLAACNGSQCGYCSPGMVMSMYGLLANADASTLTKEEIEHNLDGNICRCTGYRPILEAFQTFAAPSKSGPNHLHSLLPAVRKQLMTPFEQDPSFFRSRRTATTMRRQLRDLPAAGSWVAPTSLADLQTLLGQLAAQTTLGYELVSAHTGIGGVYQSLKLKDETTQTVRVSLQQVAELQACVVDNAAPNDSLTIGAGVTIAALIAKLKTYIAPSSANAADGGPSMDRFATLVAMMERIASAPVRNAATWAGNIVMVRRHGFASDLATALAGVGAKVQVWDPTSKDTDLVTMDLLDFVAPSDSPVPEMLLANLVLTVPSSSAANSAQDGYAYFKVAIRPQNSHSLVNAFMGAQVTAPSKNFFGLSGDAPTLSNVRIVYGALGAKPLLASKTMAVLEGSALDGSNLSAAITALTGELTDAVVAEPAYATADNPAGKLASRQAALAPIFYKWYVRLAAAFAPSIVPAAVASAGEAALPDARPASASTQTYPSATPYAPVGEAIPKLSALQQVAGEAKYVSDISETAMLHAAPVASTKALAVVSKLDASAALAAYPGQVVAFITAKDIPGTNDIAAETCQPMPYAALPEKPIVNQILVPEGGTTTYVGQRLGLIVATSRRVALEAAKLVTVTYEDPTNGDKPILTLTDAIAAKSFWSTPDGYDQGIIQCGDVDSALKSAPHTLSGMVPSGGITHFYMEKQSAVAIPEEGSRMVVHTSTQNPDGARRTVATVLGVDGSKVTTKMRRAGGAYGGKLTRSLPIAALAAVAARKTNRPVRFVLEIYHDQQTNAGRTEFQSNYQVGFDNNGKILALDINAYCGGGAVMDGVHDTCQEFNTSVDCCYYIPNFRTQATPCSMNRAPNTALRAPGHMQASFVTETVIDTIAANLGLDAQKVREANFYNTRSCVTPYLQKIEPFTLPDVWSSLQKSASVASRQQAIDTFNAANKWRKRALVCLPVKYGVGRFPSPALVNIESDGSVTVSHAQCEVGQGIHTRVAQVAAFTLGCPLDLIHIADTNTEVTPNAQMTGGSMGTGQATEAVRLACLQLKLRLSPCRDTLGLPDTVLEEDDWKSLIASAAGNMVDLSSEVLWKGQLNSSSMGGYGPWGIGIDGAARSPTDIMSYFNFGAGCTEVEVDLLSGEHTIIQTDISYDCGTPMNPALDIGQMEGAFVMGVGFYTRESQLWLSDGSNAVRRLSELCAC